MEGGWTPLYVTCWKVHVEVARLLLDKGAEVDRAMKDGVTPLQGKLVTMEARFVLIMHPLYVIIPLNVARGGRPWAMKDGRTPLWTACHVRPCKGGAALVRSRRGD